MDVYLNALLKFPMGQPGRTEIMEALLDLCQLEGLYDQSILRLEASLASSPNNLQALMTLADIHFYRGSYGNSLYLFKQVASMYQDQGRILLDRAQSLERETHFNDAVNYYQAVLDLFPEGLNTQYALLQIGKLKSQMNQPDLAIASLNALTIQSKNRIYGVQNSHWLSGYILIGDIYLQQKKDVKNALSMYLEGRNTVEQQPGGMIAYYDQVIELDMKTAECYRLMGEYDKAENILDSIKNRDQTKSILAQVSKLRGNCLFSQGDFENALTQYQEAILWPMNEEWVNDALERIALIKEYLDQNGEDVLRIYAQVERLKKTGNYDEALRLCLSNANDDLKMETGEILTLQRRFLEAISSYEQLVNSESKLAPKAVFRMAGIYMNQLNDLDKAIKKYSELIEKYPESIMVVEARRQIRLFASEKLPSSHIP